MTARQLHLVAHLLEASIVQVAAKHLSLALRRVVH